MRKMHMKLIAQVAGAFLLCASSASGAALTSGSFLFGLGALAPPPITAIFTSGSSVGVGLTATLGAGQIVGAGAVGGITASPPITQVVMSIAGNAPGAFVAGGGPLGALGGVMAMVGTAKIKAYSGLVTLVGVPLSVIGVPGATVMVMSGGGGIINVTGSGWTTGFRTIMHPVTTTAGGTQVSPTTGSSAGADLRTPGGGGTLVLISPTTIRTNLAGDIPSFAVLTLNFIPEPGTLLLLGSGVAGLALLGRRRNNA